MWINSPMLSQRNPNFLLRLFRQLGPCAPNTKFPSCLLCVSNPIYGILVPRTIVVPLTHFSTFLFGVLTPIARIILSNHHLASNLMPTLIGTVCLPLVSGISDEYQPTHRASSRPG